MTSLHLTLLLLGALLTQDPAPAETSAETPAEAPVQEPAQDEPTPPVDDLDEEARALEEGEGTGLDPDTPLHGEPSEEEVGLEKVEPGEHPDDLMPGPMQQDARTQELLDLFREVDRKLEEIDTMLFDIGAGERPLEAPEDSGLGELLGLTRESGDEVIAGIDRILELASEMGDESQSQSGGQGQQSQSQGKPQNQGQPEGQESQGEQQPEPGGQDPQEQEGQEQEGQDEGEGEQPQDSPNQDEGEGQNQPQGAAGENPVGPGSEADDTERWGELPERVRETFRNQGGEEAPLFYREWIESYYRRLNEADGR